MQENYGWKIMSDEYQDKPQLFDIEIRITNEFHPAYCKSEETLLLSISKSLSTVSITKRQEPDGKIEKMEIHIKCCKPLLVEVKQTNGG